MKAQNLEGHYAGFVSRLFAFSIDAIILVLLVAAAGIGFSIIDSIFILPTTDTAVTVEGSLQIDPGKALAGLLMTFMATLYFPFFWILSGHTPGMFLLGVTVVTLDGGHISFWRGVLRVIGWYLSAFFLFIGFLWILVDNRRQGWHDKLAGTCVIYMWPARPDENFLRDRLDSN
jgi:uncharacterized RDD family membrane protein YckC